MWLFLLTSKSEAPATIKCFKAGVEVVTGCKLYPHLPLKLYLDKGTYVDINTKTRRRRGEIPNTHQYTPRQILTSRRSLDIPNLKPQRPTSGI